MIYFRGVNTIKTLPIISILLIILNGCGDIVSPDLAQIGLKKGGKLYMYSFVGYDTITKAVPMGFIPIYKADGKYFIEPNTIKSVIKSMGGNIALYDFKEISHDGYYSVGSKDILYQEVDDTKSTQTIGEQLRTNHITITNEEKASMNISWQWNTKTVEYTPLENCELRTFWSKTSVQPGTTSFWLNKQLVVSLDELAQFYNCSISYSLKEKVLLIDVNQ